MSHFLLLSALSQLIRFAQVPDYLEATIYDKESAVIMVRPDQTYLIAFSYMYNYIQVGNLADVTTDEQRGKVNHVTRFSKISKIIFSRASSILSGGTSRGSTSTSRPFSLAERVKSTYHCESTFSDTTRQAEQITEII